MKLLAAIGLVILLAGVPICVGIGILYFDKSFRSWKHLKQEILADPLDFLYYSLRYGWGILLYLLIGITIAVFCIFMIGIALKQGFQLLFM